MSACAETLVVISDMDYAYRFRSILGQAAQIKPRNRLGPGCELFIYLDISHDNTVDIFFQ